MPIIEGQLETETEDAAACADLDNFSCGDKRAPHEGAVERLVAQHRIGAPGDSTLRVTREMPDRDLVGLAIIMWKFGPILRSRLLPLDEYRDAAYIAVATLSDQYRGRYTLPDGTPVSDYLMTETLRYIEEHEGTMPVIECLIEEDNDDSRELCFRHGFEQPFVTKPDLLYVRIPGI